MKRRKNDRIRITMIKVGENTKVKKYYRSKLVRDAPNPIFNKRGKRQSEKGDLTEPTPFAKRHIKKGFKL